MDNSGHQDGDKYHGQNGILLKIAHLVIILALALAWAAANWWAWRG
jgi:hypothetical protein